MTHRQSDSKVCLIEVASPKAVFDFIVCSLCFFSLILVLVERRNELKNYKILKFPFEIYKIVKCHRRLYTGIYSLSSENTKLLNKVSFPKISFFFGFLKKNRSGLWQLSELGKNETLHFFSFFKKIYRLFQTYTYTYNSNPNKTFHR